MGLISFLTRFLGSGVARETIEVFRPNAEAADQRDNDRFLAALEQLAAERAGPDRFGRIVDGLNRLPRPAMAFGTLGLFVFAMVAPESFAVRVSALALVPEPMWWLLGAIVSFYFGARELQKGREVNVARSMEALARWRAGTAEVREELAAASPPGAAHPSAARAGLFGALPASIRGLLGGRPASLPVHQVATADDPRPAPPPGASLIDFAILDRNPALSAALRRV
ncbi:holin family protein [Rhodovulum marinum]|uniref:Holin (3TMs family) n=1 Tax=Rhodovulum marinum TaxID=320662 RepID=A0A4R2Q529_9RHOB|nr:holin family protein [Rhodovulum marinum]TCP43923.1 holin (3TMs family) [Rhodovulum marinum]